MNLPDPQLWRLEEISIGQSFQLQYRVDEADMRAFAELSGDQNPLHIDEAFAREAGFEGRVVYGGIHLSKVSHLVGMQCPGRNAVLMRVDLGFHNPLYVGQVAQLTGVIKDVIHSVRVVQINLTIECDDKLIAKGLVEARVNV